MMWGGTWGHGVVVGRYLVTRGGRGEVPGDMGWMWGGTWGHWVAAGRYPGTRGGRGEVPRDTGWPWGGAWDIPGDTGWMWGGTWASSDWRELLQGAEQDLRDASELGTDHAWSRKLIRSSNPLFECTKTGLQIILFCLKCAVPEHSAQCGLIEKKTLLSSTLSSLHLV